MASKLERHVENSGRQNLARLISTVAPRQKLLPAKNSHANIFIPKFLPDFDEIAHEPDGSIAFDPNRRTFEAVGFGTENDGSRLAGFCADDHEREAVEGIPFRGLK